MHTRRGFTAAATLIPRHFQCQIYGTAFKSTCGSGEIGRPAQCVPLSPLTKYFVYHQWMLQLLLLLPPRQGTVCSRVCPQPRSHQERGGRGEGRCPRQVRCPPAVTVTLSLFPPQMVGCDYEIGSNATEDRCGVCLGDGSACQTVKKMFKQKEGSGNKQIIEVAGD